MPRAAEGAPGVHFDKSHALGSGPPGIERARRAAVMNSQNTGVEERDQWRERIMSALKDLRGDESSTVGRMRSETRGDDRAAPSVRF